MSEPNEPHQPNEQNPYAAPPVTEDWMLQPLPLMGSVLQQGLQICGNNWITIAALVALVWGPIELLSNYVEYEWSPTFAVFLGVMGLEFIAYPLGTAAIIAIAIAAASGRQITLAQSLRTSVRVYWRFAVTYVLCTILILIGWVVLILPGIYLMVVMSLVDSVVVQEGKWGASAIARSYDLVSRRFWPLLGLCILLGLVTLSPWFIFAVIALLVPMADTFIADVAVDISVDLVGAYPTVCLYVMYRRLAHASPP